MSIQRYDVTEHGGLYPHPDGNVVWHDDHVAEVERLTADLATANEGWHEANEARGRLLADLAAARAELASAHLCDCNPAALAALPKEDDR